MGKQTIENGNGDQLFTLAQIQKSKEIKKIGSGLVQYGDIAESMIVTNQEAYTCAGDFCKNIKKAHSEIEKKRKFFVDPYNQVVKKINATFKEKTQALAEIEKAVKNKMLTWWRSEEERKKKEQQKIEKENAKKIEKYEAKTAANPEKAIMPPTLKSNPEKIEKMSRGEAATSTVMKVWKWEIQNEKEIPREHLMIDEKKINKLVKAGLRDIPGLRIFETESMSIR